MSRLTEADVARIARLARVRVEDSALPALTKELSEVVGFVDQLQSVETEGVAETSQVTGLVDVLRPDEVVPCPIPKAELLQRAPLHVDGYIQVPRVLK